MMKYENFHGADTAGYFEVADDPLHKEVYADRYFRAYMAILSPGQATHYHRHSEDTVYIAINGGRIENKNFKGYKRSPMGFPRAFPFLRKLWFALQGVFTGSVYLPDGFFFFMPTQKYPSIHKAAASSHNRDVVRLMGIEVRCGSTDPLPLVHLTPPLQLGYDNGGLIKVFVGDYGPGASGRIEMPGCRLFMVCTKGLLEIMPEPASLQPRHLAVGDYLCLSGDSPVTARGTDNAASELIILSVPV
jgi:hypothetical protein